MNWCCRINRDRAQGLVSDLPKSTSNRSIASIDSKRFRLRQVPSVSKVPVVPIVPLQSRNQKQERSRLGGVTLCAKVVSELMQTEEVSYYRLEVIENLSSLIIGLADLYSNRGFKNQG